MVRQLRKANAMRPTVTDPTTPSRISHLPTTYHKRHNNYFLDSLGFKLGSEMRAKLNKDMLTHTMDPRHKYLTREANTEALKIMVSEFLIEYDSKYWGSAQRDHLQESDKDKSFLYPRDSRLGSRLAEILESYFDMKAHRSLANEGRYAPPMSRNIDFVKVTGRKVDLINPLLKTSSSTSKRHGPSLEPAEEEVGDEYMQNREERKRRNTKRPRLADEDTDTDGNTLSEPLHQRRRASSARRIGRFAASTEANGSSRGGSSYDNEAFNPLQRPHTQGLTRPPVATPATNSPDMDTFVILDNTDVGEEQPITAEKDARPGARIARGFEDVKTEPLTDDMMKKTMFRVTVHGAPLGPVPVPFTECGNFEVLFPNLIEERGLLDEDARKVNSITTEFAWTGGELGAMVCGIRRNKPQDWIYFCDSLRRAHEGDAARFKGRCEVIVKLHIDDKHKERC